MKISIVTVCYNAVDSIEKTIMSVLNQSYSNIEYIVVDGMSTDGTYEKILEYQETITVIHEPDRGIYDAMNKGTAVATGEYIYFLNSGDVFCDTCIIADMIERLEKDKPDILCANVNYVYKDNQKKLHDYTSLRKLNKFWMAAGITVCHQGIITKAEIVKKKKFDVNYSLWADQELVAYCLYTGKKITYANIVLCDFDAYGYSSGKDKKAVSRKECDMINCKYNKLWYLVFLIPKKMVRCFSK